MKNQFQIELLCTRTVLTSSLIDIVKSGRWENTGYAVMNCACLNNKFHIFDIEIE